MACISKRKKRARWYYAVDWRDGAGRRRMRFFPTKTKADDFLQNKVAPTMQKTRPTVDPAITVGTYADAWLKAMAATVKPATLESYADTVRLHVRPALEHMRVRDLERGQVKALLVEKLGAGYSRNSVRIIHATLRAMLNAAIDDGALLANPAVRLGRALRLVASKQVRQEEVKAMDREQRARFLAAAFEHEAWLAPMWFFGFRVGVRPGELYAVREEDLDLEHAKVRIVQNLSDDGTRVDTPKGNRGRDVDLSAETVELLRHHLAFRKAEKLRRGWRDMPVALFSSTTGGYLDPHNVRRAFRKVLHAAGLPVHFTPHGLRHTYASLMLVAGVDVYYVKRMLGHASIQETVDTYGRWLPVNQPGKADVLDDGPTPARRVTAE